LLLAVSLAVVVSAPAVVAIGVALVLCAGLAWLLVRATTDEDRNELYKLNRLDRLFKNRDFYERNRYDWVDRDRRAE